MRGVERVQKVLVNVGEVEHTSERVWKSVEQGGNAEELWRSAELSVP